MQSSPNIARIMRALSEILSDKHGMTVKVEAVKKENPRHSSDEVVETA